MKLTAQGLKKIIKEEIDNLMRESAGLEGKVDAFLATLTPDEKRMVLGILQGKLLSKQPPPGSKAMIMSHDEAAAFRKSIGL